MKVDATLTGDAEAMEKLREALGERFEQAVGAGLYLAANNVMTDAKRRVPVDTGTLRGSGYVTLPELVDGHPVVEAGFGGPASDYAVVQHEATELHHDVGEAKFLENAVNEAASRFARDVATIASAAVAGGSTALPAAVHPTRPDEEE